LEIEEAKKDFAASLENGETDEKDMDIG